MCVTSNGQEKLLTQIPNDSNVPLYINSSISAVCNHLKPKLDVVASVNGMLIYIRFPMN